MRNLILEFLNEGHPNYGIAVDHSDDGSKVDHEKGIFHAMKAAEHVYKADVHKSLSKGKDAHHFAAKAHNWAAKDNKIASESYKSGSKNQHADANGAKHATKHAEELSTSANAKNESTVVEFVDSKGDFGGGNSKRDYHRRMKDEHYDHYDHHWEQFQKERSKDATKAYSHYVAAHVHQTARGHHVAAFHAHNEDHPNKDEASKLADEASADAHKASAKTGA